MSTDVELRADVLEELRPMLCPLDRLRPLDGNPRVGDVEVVKRSYERFGQRKPIVARRVGEAGPHEVIAGNHQLEAARQLGWDAIAVVYVDDDELTAKAFALADNRASDRSYYDDEALVEMLREVAVDPELLMAASWKLDDIENRAARFEPAEDQTAEMVRRYGVLVECDDENAQLALLDELIAAGHQCRALTS